MLGIKFNQRAQKDHQETLNPWKICSSREKTPHPRAENSGRAWEGNGCLGDGTYGVHDQGSEVVLRCLDVESQW